MQILVFRNQVPLVVCQDPSMTRNPRKHPTGNDNNIPVKNNTHANNEEKKKLKIATCGFIFDRRNFIVCDGLFDKKGKIKPYNL